jgi:hypothetical protein
VTPAGAIYYLSDEARVARCGSSLARRCGVWRGKRGDAQVHRAERSGDTWTAAHRGPAFFAYSANYLIDVDHAVIVDVEATKASARPRCWRPNA